jgi:hypothetical protein
MTVEERLQRLDDERAILETIYRYYNAFDYGLEDEFADCWVEDGILRLNSDVANVRFATGLGNYEWSGMTELIEGYFRSHLVQFPPSLYWKHVLMHPRVKVDGDGAVVQSYWARLDENDKGPYLCCFGRVTDTLVRCPDGQWRFSLRYVEYESRVAMPADGRVLRTPTGAAQSA